MNRHPQPVRGVWPAGFGRPRRRAVHGFSLIEVVLALGVISIAIVSLIGLLSISTGSSRSSDEDTVIGSIARQVDTELRNKPFANLPPTGAVWYFDNEGHHLTSADDAEVPPSEAIYQCLINLTDDASYDSPNQVTNLYHVGLLFSRAVGKKKTAPILQSVTAALYRND